MKVSYWSQTKSENNRHPGPCNSIDYDFCNPWNVGKLWFSTVSKGYRNGPVAWSGLNVWKKKWCLVLLEFRLS